MTKEEIVEKIKEETESCYFQAEVDAYAKGYLDALCNTYEITWEQRYEIEEMFNNE